jgi:hypothetical protein
MTPRGGLRAPQGACGRPAVAAVGPARLDQPLALRAAAPHCRSATRAAGLVLRDRHCTRRAGHRQRIAQDEVQDDPDGTRDEEREKCPARLIHLPPPGVRPHVADEQNVDGQQNARNETREDDESPQNRMGELPLGHRWYQEEEAHQHHDEEGRHHCDHPRRGGDERPFLRKTTHAILPSSCERRPRRTAAAPAVTHPAAR